MNQANTSPSSAASPDLDWSQIRETVRMLNLAVAQIAGTMQDGDDSVKTLGDSFTTMVGNAEVANAAAAELPDSNIKEAIVTNCQEISLHAQQAIVAFQFYDRLTQRLEHVSRSLESLGTLVSDPTKLFNPFEWNGLQQKIKSKYTVEAERAMFDAILNGATVEEALQQMADSDAQSDEDDVELF